MCKCDNHNKCENCKGINKECVQREVLDGMAETFNDTIRARNKENRQLKALSCALAVCLVGAVIGLIAL